METLDFETPHTKSATRFTTKEYLLLGGGPSNSSDRVLKALSAQCLTPVSKDVYDLFDDIKAMLKYIFQTKNNLTLLNQTSGNGGNETILTNLLDPGDKVVIAIGGTWGEKAVDMAQRYNYDILALRKPPGEVFTFEELETAVKSHKAKLLFVTHGESTGGTLQRLEGLGPMCHKYNCFLAVDAVVSLGVIPFYTDRWELDAVNCGSQKGIGAPPGLCLLTFSARAEQRMKEKKTPPPYYFDMLRQGIFWGCGDDPKRTFHYTMSSNLLCAVREGLAQICEEGLVATWKRHQANTELFWKKLEEIGLECFVKKPENRFIGVTAVTVPEDIDQMKLLAFLKEKYTIDITPGIGPTLNKAMRIGLMGQNSRQEVVEYLVKALADGLKNLRKQK